MQLLSSAEKVQIITSAAVTLDVAASFVDLVGTTPTPRAPQLTAISTATTTDVVASPTGTDMRNLQTLTARNKGGASDDVTVQINRTAGTTFTTGPEAKSIALRMVGGGAGGGGCSSLAAAAAAAGGGGSGAYAEKTFAVAPNTGYTYAIGSGGAGVSGAAGGNGNPSTFAVGGVTVSCPGGIGGPLATAATTLTARAGGAGGGISTNGDLNSTGSPGVYGVVLIVATPIVASGKGADSQFGSGGIGLVAVGAGSAATGYGAGGGGSATGASAARAGGGGTAGVIIVDEYA